MRAAVQLPFDMIATPARSIALLFGIAGAVACASDSGGDAPSTTSEGSTSDDASTTATASATTSPTTTPPSTGDVDDDGSDDAASTSDDGDATESTTTEDVPEGVPVFVAQGHMGRTTISCDAGQSWIADRSLDDSVHCFDGIDCDHHVGSATGITFGGGAFVATFGWGTEGTIQRSTDGIEWETVLTGPTFAGTAFGDDVFLAGAPTPQRSTDFGVGWTELAPSPLDSYTPRGIGFTGSAFVLAGGGSGVGDVIVTEDAGDSWWHPDALPAVCGDGVRGIVGDGDTFVIAKGGGADAPEFCVSVDGGHMWSEVDLGDTYLESRIVRADDAFLVWSSGTRWSSTDGMRWTATPTEPPITIGAVARDDEGHFVAVRGGWQVWYADQEFYRSADGVTWEVLPKGAFVGSHPINHIAFGRIDAACPQD